MRKSSSGAAAENQSIDEVIIKVEMSSENIKLLMLPYREGGSKQGELFTVRIQQGVTSIGNFAFVGCTGLTSVEIPEGVTSIGESAFDGCKGLTSVVIPGGVRRIGFGAFVGCTGLTSVEIPEGVTSIEDRAFYGCIGLTSVEIPGSVTSIGEHAFNPCKGLTSVVIPGGVRRIGFGAFVGCTGLTRVVIPNSVTSIGNFAFSCCTGLTSVEILEGVTSIGSCAFYGCTGLTSIVLPGNEALAKLIWNQLPEESRVRCITTFIEKENLKAKLPLFTLLCCAQRASHTHTHTHMQCALLAPGYGISRKVSRFLTPLKLKDFPALVSEPWKLFQRTGAAAHAEASAEMGECKADDDVREGAAEPRM